MFTTEWKCDDRSKGASKIGKGDEGALFRLWRPPETLDQILTENGRSEYGGSENGRSE